MGAAICGGSRSARLASFTATFALPVNRVVEIRSQIEL
jgi:hypothetical protein